MSDSVRPHRRQPTRFPRPWDSPGKNTGVGCHFLLQCMKVKSESEVAQSCPILATPWTAAYQAPPSMGFSRQKYWSGLRAILQGLFAIQGSKQCLLCLTSLAGRFFTTRATWKALHFFKISSSVQFSHSVVSDSLHPHGLQHARLPCPSPNLGACSNLCLSSW